MTRSFLRLNSAALLAGFITALLTGLLSWIAYRGNRLVGFDPHYYLEYAKQFRTEFPASFGTHWPFGFPLLATALMRLGCSAFVSMLAVSWLAWAGLIALLWRPLLSTLGRPAVAWAAVLVFGCIPVVFIELGALRSEIAFTLFSTAALVSVAEDDSPRAWIAAAAATVLGFTIRYAGILGLATIGLWFLAGKPWSLAWRPAFKKSIVLGAAALICAGLMAWNISTRGYASGAARPPGPGLAGLAEILADLGWGGIVSFSTIGLHRALAPTAFGPVLGWAALAFFGAIAALSWWRPASRYSRPFALGLAVYLAGMAALAATRDFDPLSNARSFIPALPLLFVLVAEHLRLHPGKALSCGLVIVVLPGLAVAARGVSLQVAPDFRPALVTLIPRLKPTDSIGVNLGAVGLSACVNQRVTRIDDNTVPLVHYDWLVLTAERTGGREVRPVWSPETERQSALIVATAQFDPFYQDTQLRVWRRTAPAP